jgi:hypothetical protein
MGCWEPSAALYLCKQDIPEKARVTCTASFGWYHISVSDYSRPLELVSSSLNIAMIHYECFSFILIEISLPKVPNLARPE